MFDPSMLMPLLMGMNNNNGMDINQITKLMSAMQGGNLNNQQAPAQQDNGMLNMLSQMSGNSGGSMANMLPLLMSMMNGNNQNNNASSELNSSTPNSDNYKHAQNKEYQNVGQKMFNEQQTNLQNTATNQTEQNKPFHYYQANNATQPRNTNSNQQANNYARYNNMKNF